MKSQAAAGPTKTEVQTIATAAVAAQPKPAASAEYERVFRCRVHFVTHWNAMELHP